MFHIRSDGHKTVEAWSKDRLQFEPKGEMRDFRHQLAASIRGLRHRGDSWLYACYWSQDERMVDVENVLLYNVGTGAFRHLCQEGFAFERGFGEGPRPDAVANGWSAGHYHAYQACSGTPELRIWAQDEILAQWHGVELPALRGEVKPHAVWYSMKRGAIIAEASAPPEQYGMELVVQTPGSLNISSVAKPLLDGIISALHVHDGHDLVELGQRLSAKLAVAPAEVECLLMDSTAAVLGIRRLVHPFGSGIQWNPADDTLVAAVIRVEQGTKWLVSGNLFLVKPKE